ncbi:hypothetical protein ACIQ8D_29370 [Streptomyces sp. NPDC096094]|uniref:hypothetical protein n=1 Tax=Streptomyces sp. NPDC096094 TaxID=3366073 RepID=UPI0038194F4F
MTPRALDGVARPAGLGARDVVALRAGVRIRGETIATAEVVVRVGRPKGEAVRSQAPRWPVTISLISPTPGNVNSRAFRWTSPSLFSETATGGDLTTAVAAALTVQEDDRFRQRADTRLLSAEAEVGLAVGPDRLAEEPDDDTLSGLSHDDLRIRARDCLALRNQ